MNPALVSPTLVRTAWATALVALAGGAALAAVTQGCTVLSSEAARRASIAQAARPLPALLAVDQFGRARDFRVDPQAASPARVTIVDFIYTRCETVCSVLGSRFQQLQATLLERHLQSRVRLLTLSFDPAHDTPEALARYAKRMHADPRLWTLSRPLRAAELAPLLDGFGIVVLPVPPDQFVHNAALHVIDTQGRLAAIADFDDPEGALAQALALAAAAPGPP